MGVGDLGVANETCSTACSGFCAPVRGGRTCLPTFHRIKPASVETALPLPRLQGEMGRTCGQLRFFAAWIEEGHWLDARIDHANPARQPLPKPMCVRCSSR